MQPIHHTTLTSPGQPEEKSFSTPVDSGLRISKIARRAFIVVSAAFAFSAAASLAAIAMGVAVSTMTSIACVSATALAILLTAAAWPKCASALPEPFRHMAYSIQSIATATFSVLTLAAIFPVDLERLDPKSPQDCDASQIPILLIHGFLGSSNNWLYHRQRFLASGYRNVFTINLGSPCHSIEHYSDLVRQKIEYICQITGQKKIILIGHSMGGLVSRRYRNVHADAQGVLVQKVITVGSPLDGTYAAYLASWFSAASREMEPGCSFVRQEQEQAARDDTTEYFHIGSKVDGIVIPNSSALAGGGRRVRTAVLEATGHIEYLFSDATADLIINGLKNLNPPTVQA